MKDKIDIDYEFTMYFDNHELPDNEQDMTDEQKAIYITIDNIIFDLIRYLDKFFDTIATYTICQEDFDAYGICKYVIKAEEYYDHISYLIFMYFDKDSKLHEYCDVRQEIIDSYNRLSNIYSYSDFVYTIGSKYRDLKFNNCESIYELMKYDIRTEEAKKYFLDRRPE